MNNSDKVEGWPFTRMDPARSNDTESMSCLSLIIASKELDSFIDSILIDSKQLYSPISSNSKQKLVRSDHFPIIVTFSSFFSSYDKPEDNKKEIFTIWNTNKPGGWQCYKETSNKKEFFKKGFDSKENHTTTDLMSKFDKAMTKINHISFGKVKRSNVVVEGRYDSMNLEDIAREKRKEVCKELKRVEKAKTSR